MAKRAQRRGRKADLHVQISWAAYDTLRREEEEREARGVYNTLGEIVEDGIYALRKGGRIGLDVLAAIDCEVEALRARGAEVDRILWLEDAARERLGMSRPTLQIIRPDREATR